MTSSVANVIHRDGAPAYRQVARLLRQRIIDGTWPPGTELPSEPDLATEFSVGRDPTIRAALALLRAEGLIDVRRGYRARVRQPRDRTTIPVPPGMTVTARMPSPDERTELDIPEGVPLLELGGPGGQVYPADRTALMFDTSPEV